MIVIIDYGAGNLSSAHKALQHVCGERNVKISADAADLKAASHIVLPGVGAFGDCVRGLSTLPGLLETLEQQVLTEKKPFLGICVGMQMLFETGYEHGTHKGLGWLPGEVRPIQPNNPILKIPHMGWNELKIAPIAENKAHPLLTGLKDGAHAYFVHSFHALPVDANTVIATCDYGGSVTAAVAKDNICGVQFHPEKSQQTGLTILKNFVTLT